MNLTENIDEINMDALKKWVLKPDFDGYKNYPNHPFSNGEEGYSETLSSTSIDIGQTQNTDPNASDYDPALDPKNWPNNIYEENFSNHINPQSIFTNIEFRVGSTPGTSDGKGKALPNWVSLNAQNNNIFFKDLNIQDNGGIQKLTMNLYDKDFTNLETIVRGAVATAQLVLGQTGSMTKKMARTEEEAEHDAVIENDTEEKTSELSAWQQFILDLIQMNPANQFEFNKKIIEIFKIKELFKSIYNTYGFMNRSWMMAPVDSLFENEIEKELTEESANAYLQGFKIFFEYYVKELKKADDSDEENESISNMFSNIANKVASNITRNWSYPVIDLSENIYNELSSKGELNVHSLIKKYDEMIKEKFFNKGLIIDTKIIPSVPTKGFNAEAGEDVIYYFYDLYVTKIYEKNNIINLIDFGEKGIIIFGLPEYVSTSTNYVNKVVLRKSTYNFSFDVIFFKTTTNDNRNNILIDGDGNGIINKCLNTLSVSSNSVDLNDPSGNRVSIRLLEVNTILNFFNETRSNDPQNLSKEWFFNPAALKRIGNIYAFESSYIDYDTKFTKNNIVNFNIEGSSVKSPCVFGLEVISAIFDDYKDAGVKAADLIKLHNGHYDRTLGQWIGWGVNVSGTFLSATVTKATRLLNNLFGINARSTSMEDTSAGFRSEYIDATAKNEAYYSNTRNIVFNLIKERNDYIEKIITMSYTELQAEADRLEQQITETTNAALNQMTKAFEVVQVDTELQANLRISIGYSDDNPNLEGVKNKRANTGLVVESQADRWFKYFGVDDSYNARWWEAPQEVVNSTKVEVPIAFSDIVLKRMQNCIRSQQFYYFITNVTSKINNAGLYYTIEAFSLTSELINKYKIVQKYMNIVGDAPNMLGSLFTTFNEKLKPTDAESDKPAEHSSPIYLAWGDNEFSLEDIPDCWEIRTNDSTMSTAGSTINTGTNISASNWDYNASNKIAGLMPYEIKIPLGGEESRYNPNIYKSLASFLNDFCSKFPMMVLYDDPDFNNGVTRDGAKTNIVKNINIEGDPIDRNGNKIAPEGETITRDSTGYTALTLTSKLRKYQLTWACKQLGVTTRDNYTPSVYNANGILIWFYYKKPKKYKFIRNYDWGKIDTSIVKNLEISNASEFATMSSITVYDRSTGGQGYNESTGNENTLKAISIYDLNQSTKVNLGPNRSPLIVNRVAPAIPFSNKARYYNMIQTAYMNGVYKGKITVVGDPGLFSNKNLCPYLWPIKINIWVPKYVQETRGTDISNGENNLSRQESAGGVGSGILSRNFIDNAGYEKNIPVPYREEVQLNYMSGIYIVTDIEHNISSSGYTTTLGVLRYPGIDNDVVGSNIKEKQSTNFNSIFRSRQLKFQMIPNGVNVDGTVPQRPTTVMSIIHKDEERFATNDMPKILYATPARKAIDKVTSPNEQPTSIFLHVTDEYGKAIQKIVTLKFLEVPEQERLVGSIGTPLNFEYNGTKTYEDNNGKGYEIKFDIRNLGAVRIEITAEDYQPVEVIYNVKNEYNVMAQYKPKMLTTDNGKSGEVPEGTTNAIFGPYVTVEEMANVFWNELGSCILWSNLEFNDHEKDLIISMTDNLIDQNINFCGKKKSTGKTMFESTASKKATGSGQYYDKIVSIVRERVKYRGMEDVEKGIYGGGTLDANTGIVNGGDLSRSKLGGNKVHFFNTGGTHSNDPRRWFRRYPGIECNSSSPPSKVYVAGIGGNVKLRPTHDVPYSQYITCVFTSKDAGGNNTEEMRTKYTAANEASSQEERRAIIADMCSILGRPITDPNLI